LVALDVNGTATVKTHDLPAGTMPNNINATYSGDTNYKGGTTEINVTVSQADSSSGLKITSLTTATYGERFKLTANVGDNTQNSTGTPTGTVRFAYQAENGSDWIPIGFDVTLSDGQAEITTSALPAGNVTVRVNYVGDANFKASDVSATQAVAPKALTVTGITAQDKAYDGDTKATLTTAGVHLVGVLPGDAITPDASGATGTFNNPNVGSTKTVQIAGVTITGAANNNYAVTQPTATASITARPITVTADAQTKVYGNADPSPLTYKITSGSLVSGDNFTGSLTRAAGDNVGTYAISQGTLALSSNYTLTYVGANLTIAARPIAVTGDRQTKVLGATDPALTYKMTSGSLVSNDAFTGVLTRAPGEGVGAYNINQGTLALSNNYVVTYVGAKLTITYATTGAPCLGQPGRTILQPINADGSSVFKQGSTVPAKFRVCDANGNSIGSQGVVQGFAVQVTNATGDIVNEAVDSTTPDTTFRWSATDQLWIFNISTKSLSSGKGYTYQVVLNDGSNLLFKYTLK
jgi:hypothetical protein